MSQCHYKVYFTMKAVLDMGAPLQGIPIMKIIGFKAIVVAACVSMAFLPNAACRRQEKAPPEIPRRLTRSLGTTNLVHVWQQLAPFVEEVRKEDRLMKIGVYNHFGKNFFAIMDGQSFNADIVGGELILTAGVYSLPSMEIIPKKDSILASQEAVDHILGWVQKCNDYGVCGFDIQNPQFRYYIEVRKKVYFEILGEGSSPRDREYVLSQAKKGVTPRGDIFRHVTNDVFFTIERGR